MHLLNKKTNTKLDKIVIYLTKDEANELSSSLLEILKDISRHEHISNEDLSKEVTICIYDENNISSFDKRSQILIKEDR
ncbi:MAG: hypothetical protein WCT85_06045 [Parachlamydiales bacterium]|jgi:hypothetical protein